MADTQNSSDRSSALRLIFKIARRMVGSARQRRRVMAGAALEALGIALGVSGPLALKTLIDGLGSGALGGFQVILCVAGFAFSWFGATICSSARIVYSTRIIDEVTGGLAEEALRTALPEAATAREADSGRTLGLIERLPFSLYIVADGLIWRAVPLVVQVVATAAVMAALVPLRYRMGHGQVLDSVLTDGLVDAFSGEHSGWHTEDMVAKVGITRREQDDFALRSQKRFSAAREAGRFIDQIVGVEVKGRSNVVSFDVDEAPRPDTTEELLERLKPAFRPDGTITAGNAPGLNSGASAMIVADRDFAEANGLAPIGRLAGYGVSGVEPGMFGLGPIPAVKKALGRAGWSVNDLERIEINEAFAAVPLAVAKELGLPLDIVNMEGGAVAHGHPIGATGAVLVTRLLHAMRQDGVRRGVVTLCIGGGQGIALALEAL